MQKKFIFIVVILVLYLSTNLQSQQKIEEMRIAVLDLNADGVSERTARIVSDMLRTEFVNTGKFTVIERSQMDVILREQGLQQTGCTDQECAVQIGKLMSARKMLIGSVSTLGTTIIVNVRIVDVESGTAEYAAKEKAESEAMLDSATELLVKRLSEGIEESRISVARDIGEEPSETTLGGYYLRGIVPGWGQIYAGNTIKGASFTGIFILAASFTVWSGIQYSRAKRDY